MEFFDELRNLGVAESIIKEIHKSWSGCPVYFPKFRTGLSVKQRNQQIISEYNGSNINSLAVRYNLSVKTIYRILADARQN